MASQEILHNLALAATDEMQQHFRNLWNEFTMSVAMGHPFMLLPKYMGDYIGNAAVEAIATRFCILFAQDIYIQYDPTRDAYVIGPIENLPNGRIFRILKIIYYIPSSMEYPHPPVWTPSTPTEPGVVATSSATATSDTALVSTNKVPKPANSFILYRRDKYAELCAAHPDSPNMSHKNFSGLAGTMWASETAEVRAHYTQLARELKQQSEVANPQEQKISRRSAKNKRRSRASSRQSSGESSRQSSDQLSSNSLPGVPDSLADPVDAIIHQRAE